MATFRDTMKDELTQRGLFDYQADKALDFAEQHALHEALKGRWNEDVSSYPPAMVVIVWLSLKRSTLEWIDANAPEAWFRSVFVSENKDS
jgi:hypothetical protein